VSLSGELDTIINSHFTRRTKGGRERERERERERKFYRRMLSNRGM
jgi:hypothetical protein